MLQFTGEPLSAGWPKDMCGCFGWSWFKHSVCDVKNIYAQSITFFFLGVDLKCTHTADFGPSPRVEWKFKDLKGSQILIYFDNQPTGMDITLLLSSSLLL